ncbi:aldo/keto reductase [Methanosphaera sp. ISO3-F5]|uniref:aldo/keto reductase n=1 Tax=Methanosphaera sp. ISO3-F5 TaxID=1452353 RepID=UPI002B25BA2D|nr:aldo/keto reductase [Methanosphaera sp. ISO3-F5]WQH63541.1 aldo/keto reductase [Methanosphaera sp. ISO3-F5]
MEYRVSGKTGDKISLLGFGAMRLKSSGGRVDMDLATDLLRYAIDNGVNYIDTAYLYGNGSGSNERAIGMILESLGYRDKVFISTKMNRLAIHSREDMDVMFSNQLENLCTDRIDYYFIHNVICYDDVVSLIDMGLFDFINEKKSSGQIVNMGFSYHGSLDDFRKILDLYDWDVTLLQYNYFDDSMQAGIEGIRLAYSRGMAVVIMEPLKGGLLAGNMPLEVQDLIDASSSTRSNVDLAFSWIFDTPEVTCVLSGMNSMDMLEENIDIVNRHVDSSLSDDEVALIGEVKDVLHRLNKINCTGCNYCMPCPRDINIPSIFKLYNDKFLFPQDKVAGVNNNSLLYVGNILGVTGSPHDASLCVDCGLCVSKCPQQLDIPGLIRLVDKDFHGKLFRPFIPVIKRVMKFVL